MIRYVYANAIYSDSTECAGPLVACGWYRDYAAAAEHAKGREAYGLDAHVIAYPITERRPGSSAGENDSPAPAVEVIDPLNYYYDSYESLALGEIGGDADVRERLSLLKKTACAALRAYDQGDHPQSRRQADVGSCRHGARTSGVRRRPRTQRSAIVAHGDWRRHVVARG